MKSSDQENPDLQASDAEDTAVDATDTEAIDNNAEESEVEEVTADVVAAGEVVAGEGEGGPGVFKRILLYAAIVISAVFILLGVAGVVGAWAVNTPATETMLAILAPIDNSLQRLEGVAGEVRVSLAEASTSLGDAEQQVQDLGAGLADTNLVVEALNRIFDVDIEQSLANAGEGARSIYDTVVAVEETINAINNIPLLKVEVPGSEEMANIRTGMEEMAASVDELQQETQQRRADRADSLVQALSAPLNRLNDRLDQMQTRIAAAEERLGLAVDNVNEIQSKVPRWIDIASIVVTLLLAWLIFSQAAVIVLCWRALHPKPAQAVA